MKLFLLLLAMSWIPFNVQAANDPCYVDIESYGGYEKLVVSSIALTMIRQFIDPTVQAAPTSGFSEKACFYRVNISEKADGVKAFIFGEKISDYGDSGLRGEAGLEQALLRAIFKGTDDAQKHGSICNKYERILELECKKKMLSKQDTQPRQPEIRQTRKTLTAPRSRPGRYVHSSFPTFSIEYPENWKNANDCGSGAVFGIKTGQYGIPAICVYVSDSSSAGGRLDADAVFNLAYSGWGNAGYRLKLDSSDYRQLDDGTHVVYLEAKASGSSELIVKYVYAIKGDKLVSLGTWTHPSIKLGSLDDIVESLKFYE